MSNDHIKEFWEKQGKKFGASYEASWGDYYMIELEIETIGKYIKPNKTVLDVGCGNGYSTRRQAKKNPTCTFTGVDYCSVLISEAMKADIETAYSDFWEADAKSLFYKDETFDVVYTTRTIINLATWEEQKQAINECIRVTKPGGTVVLSEAFWEPLQLLNAMRALRNLNPLLMHDFNRYLILSQVQDYLQDRVSSFTIDDFSSVYYLGTRFLREQIIAPWTDDFKNPLNTAFYELEKQFSGGGIGIQQAVVITK